MRRRLLYGTLLLAVLAGVGFLDTRVLSKPMATRILIWLCALGLLHELGLLAARRISCSRGMVFTGSVALVAVVVPALVVGHPVSGTMLVLAAVLAGWVRLLVLSPIRTAAGAFPEAAILAAAVLYSGGLLSFLDRLAAGSPILVAYVVVAVSKASDMGGFFVGSLLGRRRIAPAISPKKTWEGTVAGICASAAVAAAFSHYLVGPLWYVLLTGALIGAASFAGDLSASGLKRWAGVKDSSALIPEFGGILDLVDGLLFAGPVALVCLYGT